MLTYHMVGQRTGHGRTDAWMDGFGCVRGPGARNHRLSVCVCVRACVRACVRVCVCVLRVCEYF